MNDKHRNLPSPERAEPVVTYSRIGSRIISDDDGAPPEERVAPTFDAVEVKPARARDSGDLGGQTLEDRLTGSGGGGRSLRFVLLAGVAAVVVGFGVLAVTFNSARQAPTASTATNSPPKKVTDTSTANAIDMTPASTPGEGKTGHALAPSDAAASAGTESKALPANETPKSATIDNSGSDVAAIDPDEARPEPVTPPIPRTKPRIEASKAEAPIPAAKTEADKAVGSPKPEKPALPKAAAAVSPAPEPDDGMFVEEVEKRLATAPRMQDPADEMGPNQMMDGPQPLPLPGAGAGGERAAVPTANATPERLVPPADIPNAGPYDQAYGTGDEDYYPQQPGAGAEGYGQRYEQGGWDQDANEAVVPAPQWVVLGVRQGRAIVDGRQYGVFMVGPGSEIPGVGTVEAIEWRGNGWVVITSNGAVLTSLADSGQRY